MGTVVLPKLNQTGTNEWADVEDNDVALRDEINGNLENVNIDAAAAIAHSKLANITAGRVLLGNASNVPTATALSGDVTINSSGVTALAADTVGATELTTLPVCLLAATSSVSSGNSTVESWASESLDTDTMHSTSANTSRITITTAGVYHIVSSVYFASGVGVDDTASVALLLNGVEIETSFFTVTSVTSARAEINMILSLSAAAYLETTYSQNSGSSVSGAKRFSVAYLSPAS